MTAGIIDISLAVAALVATAVALGGLRPRSAETLRADRMVQVTGFLVLGVVLTTIWLRLNSVDVALAEAALGGGLLGAVLVACAAGTPASARRRRGGGLTLGICGTLCGAVLTLMMALAWWRVDETLPHWSDQVQTQMSELGVDHGITAVLLGFRAMDTLLESTVLMLAGFASLYLAPPGKSSGNRAGGLGRAAPDAPGGAGETVPAVPTVISWVARLVAPVVMLVALWLLFAGSSDSGGAFQSGALAAAALILVSIAGVQMDWLHRWLPALMTCGVVAFAAAGALGPLTAGSATDGGGAWLSWDPQWAFPVILGIEILLTIGIASALYAIFHAVLPLPHVLPVVRTESDDGAVSGLSAGPDRSDEASS